MEKPTGVCPTRRTLPGQQGAPGSSTPPAVRGTAEGMIADCLVEAASGQPPSVAGGLKMVSGRPVDATPAMDSAAPDASVGGSRGHARSPYCYKRMIWWCGQITSTLSTRAPKIVPAMHGPEVSASRLRRGTGPRARLYSPHADNCRRMGFKHAEVSVRWPSLQARSSARAALAGA